MPISNRIILETDILTLRRGEEEKKLYVSLLRYQVSLLVMVPSLQQLSNTPIYFHMRIRQKKKHTVFLLGFTPFRKKYCIPGKTYTFFFKKNQLFFLQLHTPSVIKQIELRLSFKRSRFDYYKTYDVLAIFTKVLYFSPFFKMSLRKAIERVFILFLFVHLSFFFIVPNKKKCEKASVIIHCFRCSIDRMPIYQLLLASD